jgi:DNA-binding protein H-NS
MEQLTVEQAEAQIANLKEHIASVRETQKQQAIALIKDMINANNITAADFGSVLADMGVVWTEVKDKKPRKVRPDLLPKYKGPNGELWSGRGRKPNWLAGALASGATLEQFAV